MQLIELQLESEGGGVIKKAKTNFVDVILQLMDRDKEKNLTLLWSIDPYGFTVLNHLQVPQLILELGILKEKAPEVEAQITDVISLAGEVSNHSYLRFVGD
jgi:hypothetical protein